MTLTECVISSSSINVHHSKCHLFGPQDGIEHHIELTKHSRTYYMCFGRCSSSWQTLITISCYTIQWLGRSYGARFIHIPHIFPIQWGAVRSYMEFPNHLVVYRCLWWQYKKSHGHHTSSVLDLFTEKADIVGHWKRGLRVDIVKQCDFPIKPWTRPQRIAFFCYLRTIQESTFTCCWVNYNDLIATSP